MTKERTQIQRVSIVRRLMRITRITVGVVGVVVGVVVIALLLPPARGVLLKQGLAVADRALPGKLNVRRAHWRRLGTIELAGISWTHNRDSLVVADEVALSVALRPLLHRDVEVDEVRIRNGFVSIPAIIRSFGPRAATETAPDAADASGAASGFPRSGSLPGLPSVAVHSVSLTLREVAVSDSLVVRDIVLVGGVDLLAGRSPKLELRRVEAATRTGDMAVEEFAAIVDFERGLFDGKGRGRLAGEVPFELALASAQLDSFALHLAAGSDSIGLVTVEATGRLHRTNLDVHAITSSLRLTVPGSRVLAANPFLAPFVKGLPAVDGVTINVVSRLQLDPLELDVNVKADPNAWLQDLRVTANYGADATRVDDYLIRMPGLSLAGRGSYVGDTVDARISIRVDDARWLAIVAPGTAVPDPFSGAIDIIATGSLDALDVRVNADANVGGFELDRLEFAGTVSTSPTLSSAFSLALTALGLDVDVGGDIDVGDDVVLRVSPIVVRETGASGRPSAYRGVARYASDRTVTLDDVRIDGTAGRISVSAVLDSNLVGSLRGRVEWDQVPTALLSLAGIESEGLAEAWGADAPYYLELSAVVTGRGQPMQIEMPFVLPGPRDLTALLPDSARVDDLGPLRGELGATILTSGESVRTDFVVNLDATDWIDSSHVHLVRESGETRIDSLLLATLGLTIRADGSLGEHSSVRGAISLAHTEGLARFVDRIPDATFHAQATLDGPMDAPSVTATFEGSSSAENFVIPRVEGAVEYRKDFVRVDLRTLEGAQTGDMTLSKVELTAASEAGIGNLLPVRVDLAVEGVGFQWFNSLVVDTTDGVRLDVDTLGVVIGEGDLQSLAPFSLGMARSTGALFAEHMELRGKLGRVYATGSASAASADMRMNIDLSLPAAPASLGIPRDFWPRRLLVDVALNGPAEIVADVELRGFVIGDGRQPDFKAHLTARNDTVRAILTMIDSTETNLDAKVSVPARVVAYPPHAEVLAGDIDFDLTLDDFPFAVFALDPTQVGGPVLAKEVAEIDARVRIQGTTASPRADASVSVSFPDWPKLAAYRLRVEGGFGRASDADSTIQASLQLTRGADVVLGGGLRYPGQLSLQPFEFKTRETGLWFEVHTDSLALAEFDPLVPVNVSLGGALTLQLTGEGKTRDPSLAGTVTAAGLIVAAAQRARIVANSDLRIAGSVSAPDVQGAVVITQGIIQIPDLPPNLHPTDGEALLFGDSVAVVPKPAAEDLDNDRGKSAINPQFDVTVRIPGGFFIRGKGLDLELGGDLRIRQAERKPEVVGELRGIRGRLDVLGRRLSLDEGSVRFGGGDEINPALSVTLSTQINDTRVRILFGGTAQEPVVFFTSEPQMDEADIMAILLFGRPLDQLDDNQSNHMQQRTTEVVVALGTVQLQKEMSEQFGVDVFAYKAGDEEETLGSFQFGKYLNPQVLLSYVRSLDDADDSFISLEYFFTGRFKVQSVYGRHQSGMGVGWSKDY